MNSEIKAPQQLENESKLIVCVFCFFFYSVVYGHNKYGPQNLPLFMDISSLLQLGSCLFVVLAVISIGYDNIVHGKITTDARNMKSDFVHCTLDKTLGSAKSKRNQLILHFT